MQNIGLKVHSFFKQNSKIDMKIYNHAILFHCFKYGEKQFHDFVLEAVRISALMEDDILPLDQFQMLFIDCSF